MSPNIGNERPTVQDPLINYAVEIGWVYLKPEQALISRRGESGIFLYNILREKLIALNPGIITIENADQVISKIESVRNNIEGNAEVLAWLRGDRTVYVEGEKRERNVALIDYEHPTNNIFHVTDEWQYTNGLHRWDSHSNRPDVIFLINGIPLIIVETKSARKADGIEKGVIQIRRYHKETPEIMTPLQIFNVTHLISFYYGVTWNLERKDLFNWKDEEEGNFEKKVKRFFTRERILKLIGEWIIFFKRDDELRKIVLRQHQATAVEKVVERAFDPEKKRGLVWHTQGAGKTFTMIKAAEQILKHTAFEKPTVIMLVDRNELEGQLSGWITSILGEDTEVLAQSKQHLRELISSDYRGLIVSMIHKFDRADANLSVRKNIFILVDEAHRTTSGDLGNYLVAALPNATMIGFTGTPIDKIAYGKGTFKIFGKDDPKGYLDKYSILESIKDGTTLQLNYTLAPNDIRVPRAQLEEEFLDLVESEGISDIEELNKILDRALNLKTFLKAPDRVDKVAKFVAEHFKENVEPMGFKAFLVGVDREACALYKKALDLYLPPEYSAVVYTSAHNDSPLLSQYRLTEDQEKDIRKTFRKKDTSPKILIVTEKLLTGFDAPILYCMYLDKPMRDHTLLQAIARVNRPYEEEGKLKKSAGFVLDFVGIFERLEKALSFDSDIVGSVIQNLDVLKQRFTTLMTVEALPYLALLTGPIDTQRAEASERGRLHPAPPVEGATQAPRIDDKTVERAINAFDEKEKRDTFTKFFKELETLYEIISPDPFLREHIENYKHLTILYQIVKNAFEKPVAPYGDIAKKTEFLVREYAESYGLTTTMPLVQIDEKTLNMLKNAKASELPKVINLGKSLIDKIAEEKERQPFLIPISERAEAILEAYDNRQISTQEAINRIENQISDYLKAKNEFQKSGFDLNTFTIFWILNENGARDPDKTALQIDAAIKQFPNFNDNPGELRRLKAELYKILLPVAGREKMVGLVDQILKLQRI